MWLAAHKIAFVCQMKLPKQRIAPSAAQLDALQCSHQVCSHNAKESSNRNAAQHVRCSLQASHLLQLCQLPVICQALRCDSKRLIPVWGLGLHQGYLLRHQEPARCINVPGALTALYTAQCSRLLLRRSWQHTAWSRQQEADSHSLAPFVWPRCQIDTVSMQAVPLQDR